MVFGIVFNPDQTHTSRIRRSRACSPCHACEGSQPRAGRASQSLATDFPRDGLMATPHVRGQLRYGRNHPPAQHVDCCNRVILIGFVFAAKKNTPELTIWQEVLLLKAHSEPPYGWLRRLSPDQVQMLTVRRRSARNRSTLSAGPQCM